VTPVALVKSLKKVVLNVQSVMQGKLVRRVKSVPVVGTERQKQVQRFVKFARVGGRRMSVPQPVQAARLESTVLMLGCHPVKIVRRENIKILVSSKFARTVLLTLILPHSESRLKQTVKYARMKRLQVWQKAALMHPPASARKLITTLTTSRNALPVLKALTVLFTTALCYHASLLKMDFGDLIRTRLSSVTAARGKIYYSLLSLKKLGLYSITF
jgi:hypothetical protein